MRYVDKIIFRGNETYKRFYQGNQLLFEIKQPEPVEWKGLTFTALEPSTIRCEVTDDIVYTVQYSYDGITWNDGYYKELNLRKGDKVFYRGNLKGNGFMIATFSMTGKIAASGSIMSMQNGNPDDDTIQYNGEFYRMFYGCTALVSAPEFPAINLTSECYDDMFYGCTNLTQAPALPATNLATKCYHRMFNGCSSLTTAPALPATNLANDCYYAMFVGCSSLTTAPALPATNLADGCYDSMFSGCTNLTQAPALPATTLTDDCYRWMFYGCTSLVTAPELPAKILKNSSYRYMFENCSRLNEIHINARDISYYDSLTGWVKNVAPTGDFYCYDSNIFEVDSVNGIPSGWTIHAEAIKYDGLTFTALEPSTIQYTPSTVSTAQYSYDTVNWTSADNVTLNLNAGDRVFFKGNITGNQNNTDNFARFRMTGNIAASGSIMSLQAGNPQDKSLKYTYEFFDLFYGCRALVAAPELPATTLSNNCYQAMFRSTGIVTAPELPATTLKSGCYYQMFDGTTTLTSITLPATSLVSSCYGYMLRNCSSLNYIKAFFTTTPSTTYTNNWVNGVAATGTFVKNKNARWTTTGIHGVPTGWTVVTE